MATQYADDFVREGYEPGPYLEAGLPMQVWALDLEIERQRAITAAERTILALIAGGACDIESSARRMGLGGDGRLSERVLVKLLRGGAIDPDGPGFLLTTTGRSWLDAGQALARERVTFEVRLDPIRETFEWVDHERPLFATEETWTIELPRTDPEAVLRRKDDIGKLIATDGLPDDDEKTARERRPAVDLRGVSIASTRVHWRAIGLAVYRHPMRGDVRLVAHVNDAEYPPLTQHLARHGLDEKRRRIVHRT